MRERKERTERTEGGQQGEEAPPEVPLGDPAREHAELEEEIDAAVERVVRSGDFVLGEHVERLEERLAGRVGVRHGVGVASGSDALILTLRALGIGDGDEVVTSPLTFFATVEAILHVGARPVFADIRAETYDLDPGAVAEAVTPDAAALIPVHLYGQMADMRAMRAIADRAGLALIEDAAQALGAAQRVPGREGWTRAGGLGDAGCFSFFPTKNLGAWGEGGMVVTDDRVLADRVRRLRSHGEVERGRHVEVGWNSRLHELQAAVLDAKLEKLDEWNGRRRAHAAAYDRALEEVEGVEPPPVRAGNRHVYQQYTVRCRDREAARRRLRAAGVESGVYYPTPCHRQEPLASVGYGKKEFPAAERAAREVLSLPVFPTMREGERARVIGALAG